MWYEHGRSRIYYEESGTGDPVLLMPGFAGSFDDLSGTREALAAKYRVIAADLPGSGRSLPQPREYTATYHSEDARVMLALLKSLQSAPAHLVGFSDGGEVALAMAGVEPERVRSVFTWGAMGFLQESELPVFDAFETVVDAPIEAFQPFSEHLKATYGGDNARAMTRSFAAASRAIIQSGGDISRSRAANIECPVLLIAGEKDFLAPPGGTALLASEIKRGEFLLRAGAGHDVHRSDGDWLNATALEWLERH